MFTSFMALIAKDKTKKNRLTDIETKEVSMVDRAANKRRFLVAKSMKGSRINMLTDLNGSGDTLTTDANKTLNSVEFLAGLSDGMEQLITLTEKVKAYTETDSSLGENANAAPPVDEWKTQLKDIEKSVTGLFTFFPAPGEVQKTPEEIAAEKVAVDAATVEAQAKAAADETARLAKEKADQEEAQKKQALEKRDATLAALKEIDKSVSSLTATPDAKTVTSVIKQLDGVYVSGGLMIDTYDVAALEKICAAIRGVVEAEGEAEMAKNAGTTLSHAGFKIADVIKRASTTDSLSEKDGKDLYVAQLLLKSVEKDLGTPPSVDTAPVVPVVDVAALETSLTDKFSKMVAETITKALEPIVGEIKLLKTEKVALVKQLSDATATTQTRASSTETVGNTETVVDQSKLFPLDYNSSN